MATLSISAKLLGFTGDQKSIACIPCSDKSSKSQESPLHQLNGYNFSDTAELPVGYNFRQDTSIFHHICGRFFLLLWFHASLAPGGSGDDVGDHVGGFRHHDPLGGFIR